MRSETPRLLLTGPKGGAGVLSAVTNEKPIRSRHATSPPRPGLSVSPKRL